MLHVPNITRSYLCKQQMAQMIKIVHTWSDLSQLVVGILPFPMFKCYCITVPFWRVLPLIIQCHHIALSGIGGFIARTRKTSSLAAQSRLISRSLSDGAVAVPKEGIEINADGSISIADLAELEKKRKRKGPRKKSNLETQFPSYIQVWNIFIVILIIPLFGYFTTSWYFDVWW